MKKAYLIAEMTVTDPAAYEKYRSQVLATLEVFGGHFLVRGGTRKQMEGADASHHDQLRTVVLEFPSMEAALGWYDSPAYAPLKDMRIAASEGRLFFVEGA